MKRIKVTPAKGYIEIYITQKDLVAACARADKVCGYSGGMDCTLLPDPKKVKLIVPPCDVLIGNKSYYIGF